MPDFILDNTALPFPKTDLTPIAVGADATKHVQATDWNSVCQALIDTRKHVAGRVNVKSLGAVGDGVTDDRAAIQAAIALADTLGAATYFPTGTYLVTRAPGTFHSLVLQSRTDIELVGAPGAVIKHPNNAADTQTLVEMLRISDCTRVRVRGLTFDGNWGNAVTSVRGDSLTFETYVNLAALPSNVLAVISTTGFPASGSFTVVTTTGAQILTYTGKTATSFTGVSVGTGLAQAGDAVGYVDKQQKTTTIGAPSNGLALPQATINVASTTGFPSSAVSGLVQVTTAAGLQNIAYTGKTATTFTGCTGGTGVMSTGGHVQYVDGAINQIGSPMQVDPKNHLIFIYGSDGTNRTPNRDIVFEDCKFQNAYGDFIWIGAWSYGVKLIDCIGDITARNGVTLSNFAENVSMVRCRWTNVFTSAVDSEPVDGPTRDVTIDDCDLDTWFNPGHDSGGNISLSIQGGVVGRPAEWNFARTWRVTNTRVKGATLITDAKDVQITECDLRCDFTGTSMGPLAISQFCDDVTISRNYVWTRITPTNLYNYGAISIARYATGVNSAAQPGNIFVHDNVVNGRNGCDGIYVEATGGYQGLNATATGYTAPSGPSTNGTLTFDGTPFSAFNPDFFAGRRIMMGGKIANIVGNTASALSISPLYEFYTSGMAWTDHRGKPVTAPAAGACTILPTSGKVQIDRNKISCANDDGAGAGRHGINFTTESTWAVGYNDQRWIARDNQIRGANNIGIRINVAAAGAIPMKELVLTGNRVWDDQPSPTCTRAVEFVGDAKLITNRVIYGNTCEDAIVPMTGLTSGTWQTSGGYPSSWAGYEDPNGLIAAQAGSTYQQINSNTLYFKESTDAYSTGWIALRSKINTALRGIGASAVGAGAITPGLPPSVDGDIEVLIVSNNGATDPGAATLSVAARFVKKIDRLHSYGGITNRGSVWWRRRRSGDTAPTVADTGDVMHAVIFAVKDCIGHGDPFDAAVTFSGSADPGPAAASTPIFATTVDGVFVANVATWYNGGGSGVGSIAGWANPEQTEIVEVFDEIASASAAFVGMGIATGKVPTINASVDATTMTITNANYIIWCSFALAFKPAVELARSTGTITCVAKASLVDGETVTIGDGINLAKVYEFDLVPNGVVAGRVVVDVSTDVTAAQVAARLRTAILANQPALGVVDNADGTLTVTHGWAGQGGNVAMAETVANAGFLVSGLSGGQG